MSMHPEFKNPGSPRSCAKFGAPVVHLELDGEDAITFKRAWDRTMLEHPVDPSILDTDGDEWVVVDPLELATLHDAPLCEWLDRHLSVTVWNYAFQIRAFKL